MPSITSLPLLLAAGALEPADITVLLAGLAVLLGLAKLLGELARRFRQPAVLGEILAGVVLGPTVLGAMAPGVAGWLFPETGSAWLGLETLSMLGAVLLLLIAGLEVDLSSVLRQGRATLAISMMSMIVPFATGFVLAWFGSDLLGGVSPHLKLPFALFVGIALSITALPVIAKILMDLNLAKSDVGLLVMSSAMINDLVGWIGFAMVLAMIEAAGGTGVGGAVAHHAGEAVQALAATAETLVNEPAAGGGTSGGSGIGVTILLTLTFIGGMLTLGRMVFHRALPYVQAHAQWPGGVLVFVLAMALACAALTEWIGIHSIFGAFIAGVALGDSAHLRARTREVIHQFIANIFGPLFFATIGLRVHFIDAFDPLMVIIVLVVAIIGKVAGCVIGGKMVNLDRQESWAVGFGMVARGAMEIILGKLAYSHGLIGEELFVAIVVMALATSLIAGPLMQRALRRQRQLTLRDVLAENGFLPQLKARTRYGAIEELCQHAARFTPVGPTELCRMVWHREELMSTGLAHGLAAPHTRLPGLKAAQVYIGVSANGVDFDARDGEPARVICLLLSPQEDATSQIELLAIIGRTFGRPEAVDAVARAGTQTELLAALNVLHHEQTEH